MSWVKIQVVNPCLFAYKLTHKHQNLNNSLYMLFFSHRISHTSTAVQWMEWFGRSSRGPCVIIELTRE